MKKDIESGQPLLSIIIPVYNAENDLCRCINSVCGQLYNKLQIILVNDGSTDSSGEICDKFAKEDKRIEVYHIPNSGSVKARKVGLNYSKGDYIGFVDADDYIDKEMYAVMMKKACETEAELIQCAYYYQNGDSNRCAYESKDGLYDIKDCRSRFISEGLLLHTNDIIYVSNTIWSKLFAAELIKKCFYELPDKQQYGEDLLCVCMCLLEASRIALIAKPYYHYIVKDSSLSHDTRIFILENEINVFTLLREMLESYGCYQETRESLLIHVKNNLSYLIKKIDNNEFKNIQYVFPKINKLINRNIVIYGFGKVGLQYYEQICKYHQCNIVGVADKNYQKYNYNFITVIGIEELLQLEFDILLIAVKNKYLADDIKKDLIEIGINADKILWEKPCMKNCDL